jgi:hypothetical protein
MNRHLVLAAALFALGLLLVECGALSVMVSLAYRVFFGSPVPFLAGIVLVVAGSFCVVRSLRIARRRGGRRGRAFFER